MTGCASGVRRPRSLRDEAPDAGIPPGEAVVVDEVLPDRHRVAAPGDRRLDQLPVGLAGAGGGRPAGRRGPGRPGVQAGRRAAKVGGHLTGRIWLGGRRRRGRRTGIPAAFRYTLAVSRRTPVAASMRRSGQPSRPNARTCCCLSSPKMLAMSAGRPQSPRRRQRLGAPLPHWPVFRCPRLAGFGCPPRPPNRASARKYVKCLARVLRPSCPGMSQSEPE